MFLLYLFVYLSAKTSATDVVLHFSFPEYKIEEIVLPSAMKGYDKFVRINIPDAGITNEVGRPLLPVIRKFVKIPECQSVDIRVNVRNEERHSIPYPIIPKQPPIPKTNPKIEFKMNNEYYNRDEFLPKDYAQIIKIAEIRSNRIAVVEIYPIKYNPKQNKISIAKEIEIKLEFINPDWALTKQKINKYTSLPYKKMLSKIIVNYDYYEKFLQPTPILYLIIIPQKWYSRILPLAEWKRTKGYYTRVARIGIDVGGSTHSVYNYIKNAYDNWEIPPTFVALVGDIDNIENFVGQGTHNPPTDLNYSLMKAEDYFPDIDVFRLSVANGSQLDSLVNKTIKYEKNEWLFGNDWCNKAYFIASNDGDYHHIAESTHAYCMRISRKYGMICDSLWLYYGTGTPITTAINGGRSWVMYSGHGNITEWTDPVFTVQDVHNLTNRDKIPFIGTFACNSGNYTHPECFSESWIRVGDKGAICHFASSVIAYWEEDDIFQKYIYHAMFDSNITWAMGGLNTGKLYYYKYYGDTDTTRQYFEMYNMMGDGSVDIYWNIPQPITVNYPSVIPIGNYSLIVSVDATSLPVPIKDALVCAKTDTIVSGYTNTKGEVSLNIYTTQQCTVWITVTGHNIKPHFGYTRTIVPSTYVGYLKHIIDDIAGNTDGIVNPGETINMPLWVKNFGNDTAFGCIGILRENDPFVSITDSIKYFGNIAPNDSAFTGIQGYKFSVALNCTNSHRINFILNVKDANDSVWVFYPRIIVHAPKLVYNKYKIDDADGIWSPGERINLILNIKNVGKASANQVTGILRTNDNLITIIDSIADFGNILPKDTSYSTPFVVFADSSILYGHIAQFSLLLQTQNYSTSVNFSIVIGKEGVKFANHDIGNCIFTVTCQGICGFIEEGGAGSGFRYPKNGTNHLYLGSLWVGNSKDWVANRDRTADPYTEWVYTKNPDGKLRIGMQRHSHQDGFAIYEDPMKKIRVEQHSWQWSWPGYDDFVIMRYKIKNNGDTAINNIYVGQYMDFDVDGQYNQNGGGVDDDRRLVFIYHRNFDKYMGVKLLTHDTAANLTLIRNSIYIYPNGYMLDSNKIKFLNGSLRFDTSNVLDDWSLVVSAGPFDLAPNSSVTVAFAVIGGNSLNDLIANADSAQSIFDHIQYIEEPITIKNYELKQNYPNPFNKNTVIQYQIPGEGKERLCIQVYDISGRLVKTLIDKEVKTPVIGKVIWDGTDNDGKKLSSGIYFYKLKTNKFTKTKKLIIISSHAATN